MRDESSRQRILDAAEELFARRGFDATPTAKVAAEAGVPKGLLFYYFPTKIDVLKALLDERLPNQPMCDVGAVVRPGQLARSLVRLADRLDLAGHESVVLRTIVWREADTHPDVQQALLTIHRSLVTLTGEVIAAAAPDTVSAARRRTAAQTWVSTMLLSANLLRFTGPVLDLAAVAKLLEDGLLAA